MSKSQVLAQKAKELREKAAAERAIGDEELAKFYDQTAETYEKQSQFQARLEGVDEFIKETDKFINR